MLGVFGGFALAMVNVFSKTVKPGMIIAYAAFEGLALGTISHLYNDMYQGIVSQAIMVTICAFTGMLFAYKSGRIRVTPKFTKVLMTALIGYLVLGLLSMIGSFFGASIYNMSGFGLMVTIVWLYLEVLRLLSILRGND